MGSSTQRALAPAVGAERDALELLAPVDPVLGLNEGIESLEVVEGPASVLAAVEDHREVQAAHVVVGAREFGPAKHQLGIGAVDRLAVAGRYGDEVFGNQHRAGGPGRVLAGGGERHFARDADVEHTRVEQQGRARLARRHRQHLILKARRRRSERHLRICIRAVGIRSRPGRVIKQRLHDAPPRGEAVRPLVQLSEADRLRHEAVAAEADVVGADAVRVAEQTLHLVADLDLREHHRTEVAAGVVGRRLDAERGDRSDVGPVDGADREPELGHEREGRREAEALQEKASKEGQRSMRAVTSSER